MNRGGGVHTTPAATGRGWVNQSDGKVLSRHRTKVVAVAAGRARAAAGGAHDPPDGWADRGEELVRRGSVSARGRAVTERGSTQLLQ